MRDRLRLAGIGLSALGISCGGRISADDRLVDLASQTERVTTLEFTRTIVGSATQPPLQVAVSDPAQARALYRATLALPQMPTGSTACDSADVLYHLTFKAGEAVVIQADERPDGCQMVAISGVQPSLVAGAAYWARLSAGLGVPESVMYPSGF